MDTVAERSTVKIQPDSRDLRNLYKAFREMDEGSKKALKDDVTSISAWSATELQSSYTMNPYPAQAQKVAATIRANKDRIPNVTIGGSKGRFSGGAVSGQVLFGSEFGGPAPFANGGRRFPERSDSRRSAAMKVMEFLPTLKEIQPTLTARWKDAVERQVLKKWADNG
jgi:hypothetical protein